jgi:uncharacterized protein involved in propanediol utilization
MKNNSRQWPVARDSLEGSVSKSSDAIIGFGKSFASFGEIVQGRMVDENDFLVTLPVDLWSTCELSCTPINGPLVVECSLEKSRDVVLQVLEELGFDYGFHISVRFNRNIPIGKGLSSSTADMLAALRALQEVFGFLYREPFLSRVFINIEPHDAIFYNGCVAYNHRQGKLLEDYSYIPDFHIIAVDHGGSIDTVAYNKKVVFSDENKKQYSILFRELLDAFSEKDDKKIARCATSSSQIHAAMTDNDFLNEILKKSDELGALGVLTTHSGTCAGYLYSGSLRQNEILKLEEKIKNTFSYSVFKTRTLVLLQ